MRRLAFWVRLSVLLLTFSGVASAHQTSLAYLTIAKSGSDGRVTLAVAFRDLEAAVGLDDDLSGTISWKEVTAHLPAITAYVGSHLSVRSGEPCQLTLDKAAPERRDTEGFLRLDFSMTCPAGQGTEITYALFFEQDPTHRVLLHALIDGQETSDVLAVDHPNVTLTSEDAGWLDTVVHFVGEGVDHLLSGPDHLLFLFVLVLPAIFQSAASPRAMLTGVVIAVTGFTMGHALTLTAATTGYLRPPQRLIEIVIALSVLITALDNVRPFIRAPRSTLAFAFGLIHGFGFASALGALDLSGPMLALGLVGFNVGVELAQIALVIVFLPVLFAVRVPAAKWRLLPLGGSIAVAGIASWWALRRILA